MKILVSGASGFIGSRLVSGLLKNGHSVTGITHKKNPSDLKCEIINADITKSDFVVPGENFDVVYHLAAATPLEKNKKLVKKVNYEGTVNFFNKIKGKTRFFLYASGLGVFGNPYDKIVDENTPLKPDTDYSKIRLEAQRFLELECKKKLIPLTTIFLGEVYGNGGWFGSQIVTRLKKGNFKLPKGGDYFRSVIHVDDVVNVLIKLGENEPKNENFVLTDSNPVLFRDFINFTADGLRVKHPGNIPMFLAKAVLGGDAIKLLTTSIKSSNKKIKEIYEFKYPSYKEGIKSVILEIN